MIFIGTIVPYMLKVMITDLKRGGDIKDVDAGINEPRLYANLTYDPGFKIVFGTEGHSERLLMTLLNRLLPDAGIVELKYLPTERFGEMEDDGKSIFDVYCTDKNGSRFLVEMQMWSQHYFHKRAVYYASQSVLDQARVEKKYQKEVLHRRWDYDFAPVFVVCFLNFPSEIVGKTGIEAERYMSHYIFRSLDTGRALGDNVNLVFIDLYRFRKEFQECESMAERWLFSLKNMHRMTDQPAGVAGTELEELYQDAYMADWSPEKIDKYKKLMTREDEMLNSMREQREDAYNEGRLEGQAEGRNQAITTMLSSGVDAELVAKAFGLTEQQLHELVNM